MEENIVKCAEKLSELMGNKEIIAIIYNPYREGMRIGDCIPLISLVKDNVFTTPIFLLSGHGGSLEAGLNFPHIVNESIGFYRVYIPSVCASALGFMIFLSDEIIISKKSKLTQLDPLIVEEDGQVLRAVDHMNSIVKDDLRERCKQAFNTTRDQLVKFCEESKLFRFDDWSRGDFYFRDTLEDIFMKKDTHDSFVTMKELEKLEVNYKLTDDENIEKKSFELISLCRKYMKERDASFVFVSSKKFNIKTKEGNEKARGIFVN